MNLLELAKDVQVKRRKREVKASDELMELSLAWAKDEVTLVQVARALKASGVNKTEQASAAYRPLARGLKRALIEGKLTLV